MRNISHILFKEFNMTTNYDNLIPQGVLFNLQQVEDMQIIKKNMAKKLIYNKEIEVVKIGSKLHISRTELIRFLEENTITTTKQYQ